VSTTMALLSYWVWLPVVCLCHMSRLCAATDALCMISAMAALKQWLANRQQATGL
jgi:hypothetical protein